MKIFICNDFVGHYPVGTAAVVVAKNARRAKEKLLGHLVFIGLPQKEGREISLTEVDPSKSGVYILHDGNY